VPDSKQRHDRARRGGKRGFTLVTVGITLSVTVGAVGLAVDLGRAFITKNEAQAYVDSVALAAALTLDGTASGITRAQATPGLNTNRWAFGTRTFTSTELRFSPSAAGPWETAPVSPVGIKFVKVTTTVSLPVYFMPVITGSSSSQVQASAVATQLLKTSFSEGLFPFSPFAHNNTGPHYGLTVGQVYTLRWAANPRPGRNVCAGDDTAAVIDLAQAGGGSERGFIESTSASIIRATIVADYQSVTRTVGDIVNMTGGAKQTMLSALEARIAQDTNTTAATYANYLAAGNGNGRRLVAAPVNRGSPSYQIVQIGAFFLRPANQYNSGGNNPWCAEYVGSWVQGSRYKGVEATGAYVVRLVD